MTSASARADDRFTLVGRRLSLYYLPGTNPLIHRCSSVGRDTKEHTTRSQLDPMALGTCRYCGEPLPVPHESDGA